MPTVAALATRPIGAADASILIGGQGGSMVILGSTWSFGAANNTNAGDYNLLINGVWNNVDTGFEFIVGNSGQLYRYSKFANTWYRRQGATWTSIGSLAPDGLIIYGGQSGILTTSEGAFSFGAASSPQIGDWNILLNGVWNGSATASQMQITNGLLYAYSTYFQFWYVRQNNTWIEFGPNPPVEAPNVPLANGTYFLSISGTQVVDGGFGYYGEVPAVQFYPANGFNGQQWVWNSTTGKFSNVMVAAGGAVVAGPFMLDNGDGTVNENATGDAWTVTGNNTVGYKILNNRTGLYLSNISNSLGMSATQTPWTISSLAVPNPIDITFTPSSISLPADAGANTFLTTIGVVMSDNSTFTGSIALSNTNFFAMSGANLVTARALVAGDVGSQSTNISVTQGAATLTRSLGI
jgi:hypothetical protein